MSRPDYCTTCHKMILYPDQNYGINPDAVCKCAAPTGERGKADEVAWLIERESLCIGFCGRHFKWVTFTDENALRFSRRVDAENFKNSEMGRPNALDLEDAAVVEHSWSAPSQQTSPAPAEYGHSKSMDKRLAAQGAAPQPSATGYFDPNDIRERWAQLYNHTSFMTRQGIRTAEVRTEIFDEFNRDLPRLLEFYSARAVAAARVEEAMEWHPMAGNTEHTSKVLYGTGKECASCVRVAKLKAELAEREP